MEEEKTYLSGDQNNQHKNREVEVKIKIRIITISMPEIGSNFMIACSSMTTEFSDFFTSEKIEDSLPNLLNIMNISA